jgi:hypothetical protein
MIQQVTITAESPVSLKPLIEGAIRAELKLLQHGINRTRERLAVFEKQYGMTTEEFERRFRAREIQETLDYLDWWMEVEMLHLLQEKTRALQEARLD